MKIITAALALLVLALPARAQTVLHISATVLLQGRVLGVSVRNVPVGAVTIRFAGRTWPAYRDSGGWQTYLGTDPSTRPGSYPVIVEVEGRPVARGTVTVTRVAFARRRVTLDPAKEALLRPQAVAEERRKVNAALRVLASQRLWRGRFMRPVSAALSSAYGVLSIYNGVVRGFHGGADFAAPLGTPVRAANDGIIRLADRLPLSGNAVIIDHGMGILTLYLHMSHLDVHAGQRVRRNDRIGLVGSTGVATGPHLHWSLRVSGVAVDPLPWTATIPP